jgi:hypothetical protein
VKLSLDDFELGTESSEEAFWARPHFIDSDRFIEMVKTHLRQQPQRAQRAKILGSTPNSWQEFEFQLLRLVASTMIDIYQEETATRRAAEFDDSAGACDHQFEEELLSSISGASAKKSKATRSAKRCPAKRQTPNPFSPNLTVDQQEAEDEAALSEEDGAQELGTQDDVVIPLERSYPHEDDGAEEDEATSSEHDSGGTYSIKDAGFAEGAIHHDKTVTQEELAPTTTTTSEAGSQDVQELAPMTFPVSEAGSQDQESCADLVASPEVERWLDIGPLYPQAQLVFQTRPRRPRSLHRGWRTPDPSPERVGGSLMNPPLSSGWQLCIGGAAAETCNDDISECPIEHPTQLRMPSRTPSPPHVRHAQQSALAQYTEKVPATRGDHANAEPHGMPETMFSCIDYEKQAQVQPLTPRAQSSMQAAYSMPPVPWVFVPVPMNIPQPQAPGTWLTEESFAGSSSHSSEHLSLVDDYSLGSAGHPHSCAAACKYARKPRGCKEGKMCDRCHLCFWRKGGNKEPHAQSGEASRRSRALTDASEASSSWGC